MQGGHCPYGKAMGVRGSERPIREELTVLGRNHQMHEVSCRCLPQVVEQALHVETGWETETGIHLGRKYVWRRAKGMVVETCCFYSENSPCWHREWHNERGVCLCVPHWRLGWKSMSFRGIHGLEEHIRWA